MHLPIPRDRQVQGIEPAVDHHHPEFPRLAVAAARIEIFDRQQFIAGKALDRASESLGCLDQYEIASGVVARRAQQQRE